MTPLEKLPSGNVPKGLYHNRIFETTGSYFNHPIKKLVQAIVEEKDFEIVGGNITYKDWGGWGCWDCDNEWHEDSTEKICPKCSSSTIFRLKKLVISYSENSKKK